MEALESVSRIQPSSREPTAYVQELLSEAVRTGILSAAEGEAIQFQILSLLADIISKYTKRKSSSVRIETAQSLLESIFYTIYAAVLQYPNAESAILGWKEQGTEAFFLAGQQHLKRLLDKSHILHQNLCDRLFQTPNSFYCGSIKDGISGFFKLYRPQYFAQETHITADYPVYIPFEGPGGILFIWRYLRELEMENLFLTRFPPKNVHHILEKSCPGYENAPVNLFGPVLIAALGIVLAGGEIQTLTISGMDRIYLEQVFQRLNRTQTEELLAGAAERVSDALCLPDRAKRYLKRAVKEAAFTVCHHSTHKTMVLLFPDLNEKQRPSTD